MKILFSSKYNTRYNCRKAEDLITNIMKSLHTTDIVAILDPPRAGIRKFLLI
jgi:tRNA/tmRNA/rRNA uracil-C5-methylase (TrmA/RlmC/RlmD family)